MLRKRAHRRSSKVVVEDSDDVTDRSLPVEQPLSRTSADVAGRYAPASGAVIGAGIFAGHFPGLECHMTSFGGSRGN
jgi:hypothetical protein